MDLVQDFHRSPEPKLRLDKTHNKGGGRAANSAIRIVAVGRLGADGRTRAYAARKMSGGHSEPEAIRCVKRYIARELYYDIIARNRMLKTA